MKPIVPSVEALFDGASLPSDWQLVQSAFAGLDESLQLVLFDPHTPKQNNHGLNIDGWQALCSIVDVQTSSLQQLNSEQVTRLGLDPSWAVWGLAIVINQQHKYLLILDGSKGLSSNTLLPVFYSLSWLMERKARLQVEQALAEKQQWIHDEIEDISRLQRLMLPDESLTIPGIRIAYAYRALSGAGGDYLDIVDLSKDRVTGAHDMRAIIADVTGHGPSAAIETAMVDAILRTFAPSCDIKGPAQALNYLNQHFFTRKERGRFVTASIFRYLADKQILVYANAGHPPAYIKRGDTLFSLTEGGIPIGVLRDNLWQSYQFEILDGDVLFMYSDVLIETKNVSGQDFGFDQLERLLSQAPSEPKALIETVEQALADFCQCKKYADDMTLCAIQFAS